MRDADAPTPGSDRGDPGAAGAAYGISRRSIHRYITQGLLPAYRIGPRNIRLDADEVERILLGNRMGAIESVEHSA